MTALRRVGPSSARLAHTISVLGRYGVGSRLHDRAPGWVRRHLGQTDAAVAGDRPEAERLRLALEELGPIYVKLGQLLSVSGMVPPEVEAALASLQEHADPRPPEEVRATVERELGAPVDELFQTFEPEPLGVASIGQVHAATLPDGTAVAVKVQHDGIDALVHEDLDIIAALAGALEDHVAEARAYRPRELADRFRRRTLAELDFHREAANCVRFRESFGAEADVRFPRPVLERSDGRVLTLELLDGPARADGEHADGGLDGAAFARRTAELWMDMIFRDGFVHADPHPGNIFVLPGGRIGVIDCGMVMRVDDETRTALAAVAAGVAAGDPDAVADTLLGVCEHGAGLDRDLFAEDVERALAPLMAAGAAKLDLGTLLGELRATVRRHGLEIPAKLDLLAQVGGELEGTLRTLDPGFHLAPVLRRVLRRLAEHRLSPAGLLEQGESLLRRLTLDRPHLLHGLEGLARQVASGSFSIDVRHSDADEAVDRLTYGLLAAALLIGGPIVWHADPPPRRNGVSVVGAGMTGAAVVLAADLVRRVRRRA